MGITARGAWESVRRHFRHLGIDPDRDDFTVVGIGDMSGDVFGNGMLLSHHIRLVAAFDHRHVFLDPDPDPARSFARTPATVRAPGFVVGRLRPVADLTRRRRLFTRAQSRSRSPRKCGLRSPSTDDATSLTPGGHDPSDAVRTSRPALQRRHRYLREGAHRDATPTSATRRTTPFESTGATCGAAASPRAATSASRRTVGSSTRSAADASTPTPSTTARASTPPTTRSTSRSSSTAPFARVR